MAVNKSDNMEWFGIIPDEWDITRIGDLYTYRNEKVDDRDFIPLSVTMQGILPQLETAAKSDAHDNRKLVRKGDFAINSRSDRRGSCGISPCDGSVSLINTVLAPRNDMNPRYYDWLFHSVQFADEFYKWGHGIVDDLWTTRWQEMKRILIPVPSLKEQHAIADYLDERCAKIDAIIDESKKSIEEYKELKQATIHSAVIYGISDTCNKQDSGIEWMGSVPASWKRHTLLRTISFSGGSQPPASTFIDHPEKGYVRLIQNRDYRTDAYPTYVPKKLVTKFCDEKDVMIGRYGPPLFVIHRGLKGAYNVALMKAIPILLEREFMYYFLQ